MSYATLEDLIERAGESEILEIADRDGDGIADPDVIAAALASADNVVNGYVSTKYVLPFATVPDLVKTWAASIARHYLHRRGPPDYVENDYKDAIAALKDVAGGKLTLPVVGGATPATSSGDYLVAAPRPHFGRHTLRGWDQR